VSHAAIRRARGARWKIISQALPHWSGEPWRGTMAKPAILDELAVQPHVLPQFGRLIRANAGRLLSEEATGQPRHIRGRTMGSGSV